MKRIFPGAAIVIAELMVVEVMVVVVVLVVRESLVAINWVV